MSVFFIPLILYFFCAFSLKKIIVLFRKTSLIDKPTERSNHRVPTPTGAGIIIIPSIIFSSILVFLLNEIITTQWLVFFISCSTLMIISFIDDLKGLPSKIRLMIHFFCVGLSLFSFKDEILIYSQNFELFKILALGPTIDFYIITFLLIFFWLWVINLFNFMDGMDGITSVQVIFLTFVTNILSLLGYLSENFQSLSIIILAAFLAFYNFNKPTAKVFLGDVGSIPMGYIAGFIIITSLLQGGPIVPLLIITMYHLMDASITLINRIIKRRNVFEAHSDHFFQKALRSGQTHRQLLNKIIFLFFFLLLLSMISIKYPLSCLLLAILLSFGFLVLLHFQVKK